MTQRVTRPIALDKSINTTESTPRNIADVLAQQLEAIKTAIESGGAVENPDAAFVCYYGVTTATQIKDAIEGGKVPYFYYNGVVAQLWKVETYKYTFRTTNTRSVEGQTILDVVDYVVDGSIWSTITREVSGGSSSGQSYIASVKSLADFDTTGHSGMHSVLSVDNVPADGIYQLSVMLHITPKTASATKSDLVFHFTSGDGTGWPDHTFHAVVDDSQTFAQQLSFSTSVSLKAGQNTLRIQCGGLNTEYLVFVDELTVAQLVSGVYHNGDDFDEVHTLTEAADFNNDDGVLVDGTTGGPRFMLWQTLANKVLSFIKSLSTTITAFRTGDVIPVDGPSGTAKMSKDTLLAITAQNAVDSGVAASADDIDTFWLEKNLKYFQMGYLNADGTIGTSTARGVTDYIEVDGIFKVATVSGIASIWAGGKTYACWYDENKVFISNETTDPVNDDVVVVLRVPSGAKYVRFTMTNYWTDSTIHLIGGENLRYLEERIDETREWVKDNLSAKGTTLGYLNADGTIGSSTIRSTTDYIDIEGVERIDTKGNIASITASSYTFACFYDSNKDFVAVMKTAAASENVLTSFAVPIGAKYIRFTCKDLSGSAQFDIFGGDVIGVLHRNLDSLKESLTIYGSDMHEGKYEEGFLNADGTIGSSTYRGVTDYIDIEGAIKISVKSGVASIYNAGSTYACFYDKDKTFISNLTTASATDDVVEEASVPNQAKYIRFTLNTKFEYATFSLLSDGGLVSQAEDKNPYRLAKNFDKRFYLFGGSLTYNFAVTYDSWKKWVDELKMRKWRCHGQGGAGFSNTLSPNIQNQVGSADSSADVYVLWCSGNDYYNQVEIGTPSDYTSDDSYDSSKLATQCGGMNYCIKNIYTKNPNATIVIMTSIKIFQSRNGWINEEGVGTHTLWEYVQAQKKVAERWGIPCLDQFAECGFNESNYTQYYMPDAGHLTDVGYAKVIARQIEFLSNCE